MTGLAAFPKSFKEHKRFAELEKVTEEINNHDAMKVREEYILHNMIRASLIFTICFYSNLLAALGSVVRKLSTTPHHVPEDNKVLHLFLQLATEELATKNIPTEKNLYSPHYVAMLEAAKYAGVDVSQIEEYNQFAKEGTVKLGYALNNLGFTEELKAYMLFSVQCVQSVEQHIATIALRELTLSANFKTILDSLYYKPEYSKYCRFLSSHIELDSNESNDENHGQLMLGVLDDMNEAQVTLALDTMIEFYTLRKAVYDTCLTKEGIYHISATA
jgi:hypothetical protein